jgi:hypothetical protein
MSSHVTIKKNLIIFHRPGDWMAIYTKILKEFGQGMAVRTRLRRELGFTYREHQHWFNGSQNGTVTRWCESQIHVDFYNEASQSWFQLRYL